MVGTNKKPEIGTVAATTQPLGAKLRFDFIIDVRYSNAID
jgi:hypothetical protein